MAAKQGNIAVVKTLLRYGADPWVKTSAGRIAVHSCKGSQVSSLIRRAMISKMKKRHLDQKYEMPKMLGVVEGNYK